MMRGVYYVALGAIANWEAIQSIGTLREFDRDIVVALATDQPNLPIVNVYRADIPNGCDQGGRLAKVSLFDAVVPSIDQVLYLDADTRVYDDLSIGFEMLDAGWDLVITASGKQGEDCMWHVDQVERAYTFQRIGNPEPLALQGGVFWVKRNTRTVRLFRAWRDEWLQYRDQDQAALLRALDLIPVSVGLLGRQFNGDGRHGKMVIGHKFGTLGRKKP